MLHNLYGADERRLRSYEWEWYNTVMVEGMFCRTVRRRRRRRCDGASSAQLIV